MDSLIWLSVEKLFVDTA